MIEFNIIYDSSILYLTIMIKFNIIDDSSILYISLMIILIYDSAILLYYDQVHHNLLLLFLHYLSIMIKFNIIHGSFISMISVTSPSCRWLCWPPCPSCWASPWSWSSSSRCHCPPIWTRPPPQSSPPSSRSQPRWSSSRSSCAPARSAYLSALKTIQFITSLHCTELGLYSTVEYKCNLTCTV